MQMHAAPSSAFRFASVSWNFRFASVSWNRPSPSAS
jgi:hypothetical protein